MIEAIKQLWNSTPVIRVLAAVIAVGLVLMLFIQAPSADRPLTNSTRSATATPLEQIKSYIPGTGPSLPSAVNDTVVNAKGVVDGGIATANMAVEVSQDLVGVAGKLVNELDRSLPDAAETDTDASIPLATP